MTDAERVKDLILTEMRTIIEAAVTRAMNEAQATFVGVDLDDDGNEFIPAE
jgi:hypothetical protein